MPRDDRRPLPKKAARTRMLMKAPLGWLNGFPLGWADGPRGEVLNWWTPPGTAELTEGVGERELRRASRALLEIRTELRETLPQLLPEPERWLACAEEVLAATGRIVHHGEPISAIRPPLPRELTGLGELRRERPRLAPLVDAVAWTLWTRPWLGKKVVRWLRDHVDVLDALFDPAFGQRAGLDPILPAMAVVAGAAEDGLDDAASLLAALIHPQIEIETRFRLAVAHAEALLPSKESVEKLRKGRIETPGPTQALGELGDFVLAWAEWERPRRRAAAYVWAQVFDGRIFTRWADWWTEIGEIRERLSRFDEMERTLKDPAATLAGIEKSLRKHLDGDPHRRFPLTFVVSEMIDAVTELSEDPDLLLAVRRALDVVPARWSHMPSRPIFVIHWKSLLDEYPSHVLSRHLDSFRRLVAAGGRRALAPWSLLFNDGFVGDLLVWTPDDFLLDWTDPPQLDSVPMVRAAVELFDWQPNYRDLAFFLCLSGADVETAKAAVEWALAGGEPSRDVDAFLMAEPLRAAVEIAPDAECLGRILLRMGRLKDSEPADLLMAGARHLAGPRSSLPVARQRTWATAEMIDRDPGALVDLGRRHRLVEILGDSSDAEPEWLGSTDRGWIDAYPAQLRSDLHFLADCDLDGAQTARRILRRDVRDTRSLQRELDAIVQRIERAEDGAPAELSARRDKLVAWISEPQSIPERKLARLRLKLRRAAGAAKLEDVRSDLDRRIEEALRRLAEQRLLDQRLSDQRLADQRLDETPASFEVLLQPESILLLEAVASLYAKAARRFGLEILLRRCLPPPWDLRDHPGNRKFRERMAEAGVDLTAWIDGDFRRTLRGDNDVEVILSIERDPLDVLRMGAPFGTCLSPWDFNFHSAVSNAADVNKQVVYGRDRSGRILGRCLLALGTTDPEGQTDRADALVAFYPYCHDAELGFRALMGRYAAELAETLSLPLVTRGNVARLVCPYWYDDGPNDLRGDLDFLDDESPFRESLSSIEPNALADAFAEAAPRDVDAHLVAALLPYLKERPELVTGLVSWIERLRLPAVDRLRAASLARLAGRGDLARRWIEQSAGHLRGQAAGDIPWWNRPVANTLADLAPSLALRLLRETRGSKVRSWSDEANVHRLWVAGRAHLALHRKKKAKEIFQLLVDQASKADPLRVKARNAVATLAENQR